MPRSVHPRQARHEFLDSKKGVVKDSTHRAYEFPTKSLVQFLEEQDVDSMLTVEGYHIEEWKIARKDEGIRPATLKSNVKQAKTFLIWCERASYLRQGVGKDIPIPDIPDDDEASHEKITAEEAGAVLDYLESFEYASRIHASFLLLWETGCRVSGLLTLDVDDFDPDDRVLEFKNRRSTGTPLKNGNKSERNVTITEKLSRLLTDWIEVRRPDFTDEFGREPLFCTDYRRVQRQRVYKNITGYTRPCVYAGTCPIGREKETCEWGYKKSAYGCPSSVSTHPVRRGSITHHLNVGWPKAKVSERCDVSIKTLDKHYNEQKKEDERANREKYVELL